MLVQQTPGRFLADNSKLRATTSGVNYRKSKHLDDWGKGWHNWGRIVNGKDEGDDWIQVDHPDAAGSWLKDVDWARMASLQGAGFTSELRSVLEALANALPVSVIEHVHSEGTGWYGASEYNDVHVLIPIGCFTLEFAHSTEYHD